MCECQMLTMGVFLFPEKEMDVRGLNSLRDHVIFN